jgi:hypothetical protein
VCSVEIVLKCLDNSIFYGIRYLAVTSKRELIDSNTFGLLAVLIENFRGFLQSVQRDAGVLPSYISRQPFVALNF